MCGFVDAISAKESIVFLLEGLNTLEYRGYNSAGLAVMNEEGSLCLGPRGVL